MQVSFDRQLSAIFAAGPKDVAKMTRALEGVELHGVRGAAKRLFGWITGKYTLARLERAYDSFFTDRKSEITDLKETKNADPKANERYAMLQSRFRSNAAHLAEEGSRDRLKGRISEELPGEKALSYSGLETESEEVRINDSHGENQPSKAKGVRFSPEATQRTFYLDPETEAHRGLRRRVHR